MNLVYQAKIRRQWKGLHRNSSLLIYNCTGWISLNIFCYWFVITFQIRADILEAPKDVCGPKDLHQRHRYTAAVNAQWAKRMGHRPRVLFFRVCGPFMGTCFWISWIWSSDRRRLFWWDGSQLGKYDGNWLSNLSLRHPVRLRAPIWFDCLWRTLKVVRPWNNTRYDM